MRIIYIMEVILMKIEEKRVKVLELDRMADHNSILTTKDTSFLDIGIYFYCIAIISITVFSMTLIKLQDLTETPFYSLIMSTT